MNVENKEVETSGTVGLDNWMESGTSKPNRGYRKNQSKEGGDRNLVLEC